MINAELLSERIMREVDRECAPPVSQADALTFLDELRGLLISEFEGRIDGLRDDLKAQGED